MSDKLLTAFHTTAKSNVENILNNGFYPSTKSSEWLGKGVYFYRDIYFAVQWAFIGVVKNNIANIEDFAEQCSIISVDLNCEKYQVLDVNTPDGYKIFLALKDLIKKFYSEEKCQEIYNKGDAYIFYTLELLEKQLKQKFLSCFDIICAEYDNNIYNKKRSEKSDFTCCKERQICIKNTDAIENITTVDLTDANIVNIFNLVKENRGDLYD